MKIKIIDCHLNCGWDVNNTRKNLLPIEQTYRKALARMKLMGVEKAIILPFPSPAGQFDRSSAWYDIENNYLIQAAEFSDKLLPFPGVNPADPRSVKNIQILASTHNIKGIKFSHQTLMRFSIDELIGHPLMKIVKDNNLIMMIHIGTGKERGASEVHCTLPYAIKVVKKYPEVTFILCHLGRLHKDIFEALDLHNVYVDTSGLALHENWQQFVAKDPLPEFKNCPPTRVIEILVEEGYAHKIIFGSDEPYTAYEKQIEYINKADISRNVKEMIFHRNVENLLNELAEEVGE
jgi:predicted TIM-barrel fold metal-dependent hydrolase